MVTETEGSTGVTEAGSTDLSAIVLNAQPDSDVVLQLTSADAGELQQQALSLYIGELGYPTKRDGYRRG